jgi:hypothetical protein
MTQVMVAVLAAVCSLVSAEVGGTEGPSKVLFVYDKTDRVSTLHVDAFRDGFKKNGSSVIETAVDGKTKTDVLHGQTVVLYSMVMAFDNISPVRAWLKKQKPLNGKRVYVFVTANRWFYKKHLKQLIAIIRNQGGEVIDGMTMATSKMSREQKREAVMKMVGKVTGR